MKNPMLFVMVNHIRAILGIPPVSLNYRDLV